MSSAEPVVVSACLLNKSNGYIFCCPVSEHSCALALLNTALNYVASINQILNRSSLVESDLVLFKWCAIFLYMARTLWNMTNAIWRQHSLGPMRQLDSTLNSIEKLKVCVNHPRWWSVCSKEGPYPSTMG